VFDSIPVYSYTTAFATNKYLTNNSTWNASLNLDPGGTSLELLRENGRGFQYLNKTECIQRYVSAFTSGKDLIVVTDWSDNQRTLNDGTSLIAAFQNPNSGNNWDTESIWVCYDNGTWPKACNHTQDAANMATNWTVNFGDHLYETDSSNGSARVDYCLSGGTNVANLNCGFHWSITIMVLVSILNLLKLICIMFVGKWVNKSAVVSKLLLYVRQCSRVGFPWRLRADSSKITLGDAISNFLQHPDPYTKDMCMAPKSSFLKPKWETTSAQVSPRCRWWFSGASRTRWILTILSWVIGLCNMSKPILTFNLASLSPSSSPWFSCVRYF
jgi:hypothetical protein